MYKTEFKKCLLIQRKQIAFEFIVLDISCFFEEFIGKKI